MKITTRQLNKLGACEDGIVWFKAQKNKEAKSILRACVEQRHFDWANWYVIKSFTQTQLVTYSIFSAESVLSIFEKEFPTDKRPRNAIEAAKNWINRSSEAAGDAWYAAGDAWYAAGAARAAARAAGDAAWVAAEKRIIEKAIEILGL